MLISKIRTGISVMMLNLCCTRNKLVFDGIQLILLTTI